MKIVSTLFIGILLVSGCIHKPPLAPQGYWNEEAGRSLRVKVEILKIKNSKADMVLLFENRYPFTVVVPEGSVQLDMVGERAIGVSNPHLVLRPGEVFRTKKITLVYQTPGAGQGKLSVAYIYEGKEAIVNGVNTTSASSTMGAATIVGNVGFGVSHTDTEGKSLGYATKSAVEGRQLPSIEIPFK